MKINKNDRVNGTDQQMTKIKTIARAGASLFGAKGYPETSMDDIAKASRMTKGGVYHYFHSKEEILHFICSACIDLKLRDLEEILENVADPTERVRLVIVCLVNHSTRNARTARIMLNESRNLSQKRLKIIREKERRCLEIVTGVIADFLAQHPRGKIVTALCYALFGMLDGMCLRFDPKHDPAPEELSQLIFVLFVDGTRNMVSALSPAGRGGRVSNA
ncbi:MAG: HTH-type transcriptional repressor KstR2 [Syntrophorhabdaceae bacterium PtaU1.Bin034]|jgi:AcrR family transcriptional regulator|nr:MAG: HTH-type transcriptional repressor KstR2 [Syntrophorhabdaceae bacterium PtaU1.Bin034]